MKTAHYFASRSFKRIVISDTTRPEGMAYLVTGKVQARKVAKEFNAKCWNF